LIAAFVLLLIYRGGAVVAEAPLLNIDHIVVAVIIAWRPRMCCLR